MGEFVHALLPLLVFSVPLSWLWFNHEQKMLKIRVQGRNPESEAEMVALRAEVRDLKEMLHTQMLANDRAPQYLEPENLRERVGNFVH